jgi:hypothetical protein
MTCRQLCDYLGIYCFKITASPPPSYSNSLSALDGSTPFNQPQPVKQHRRQGSNASKAATATATEVQKTK